MRKIATLAAVAITVLLPLGYAQGASMRLVSGIFSTAGMEYEWSQDDKVAYSAGIGLLQLGPITGLDLVGGTQFYFLGERQGPYVSIRFATGWMSYGLINVQVYLGLITSGYRLVADRLEFSGEVGFAFGSMVAGPYIDTSAIPTLGFSVGYRF